MKIKIDKPKPSEADLKRAVGDYLQYKTNLGELYADRLNSGAIYEKRGDKTFGVQLCREGTADFIVIKKTLLWDGVHATHIPACQIIFLELKGEKGKQRPEQKAFQILVESQGAEYRVIRSIEEVIELFGNEEKIEAEELRKLWD